MAIPDVPESVVHLITENVPLWPLTSMHGGGPTRWLAKPRTVVDLKAVLAWIQEQRLSHLVLGGGTNVLFPDDGYPGVVVWMRLLKGIQIDGPSVIVAAGELLTGSARHLNHAGLSGLEWACGIPGTIGGAVVMNAGTRDGDMASVLSSVRILTTEGVREASAEQLEMGYRTSALLTGKVEGIVLEASFVLRQDDPNHCLNREREVVEARQRTQPTGASSGCIFKNPETGSTAGELLDQAGCKGLRIGNAYVSDVHANFIINEGENNTGDVLKLIQLMKSRVMETHSIDLQPEILIIE